MFNLVECSMIMNNIDKNNHFCDGNKTADTMSFLGILSPAASSVDSSDIKLNSPMSMSSLSPVHGLMNTMNTTMCMDDGLDMPSLRILEEPVEKFRFRYKSEMAGTHGSLTGRSSDKIRKNTYPTVELINYDGPAIIRCSIYQFKTDVPHAHRLVIKVGNGEKDDPHDIEVSPTRGYTAIFQGMGIIHTAKKHLLQELSNKMLKLFKEDLYRNMNFRNLTRPEESEICRQAEIESKIINLNTVRLKFEAFKEDNINGYKVLTPLCRPVFSNGINNLKSALTGELKIVRLDHTTASCVGGQEIFILVEKVTKNNIKVRFFECDEDDNEIWADYGKFSHNDVHHQYAIVFKTPPYRDLNIESPVNVCIELLRPSDGARSEPRSFKYKPQDKVGRKRVRYSDSFSSNELPLTINNVSFGSSSISVPDSLIVKDPNFFNKEINLDSAEFEDLFQNVGNDYKIINETIFDLDNIVTDAASSSTSSSSTKLSDSPNFKIAKKVVNDLEACLKKSPPPHIIETLVNNLFNDFCTDEGNNALHTCILCEQYQHLQYILVLLSKMKHLKILDIKNNSGETALHLAVKINNPTVVKLLLPVGADGNIVDKTGNTPLHVAVLNDLNLEEYSHLLNACDVNKENDEGHTSLHLAVLNGNLKSVMLLVKANADVNHQHPSNGNTALHMAIQEKEAEILKFLLEKSNARIDIENFAKITPVYLAKILITYEDASVQVFKIISDYVKEKGFESLMIKMEPEEDESSCEETEAVNIKLEPKSPESMDTDFNIAHLKNMQFNSECISSLSKLLDNSVVLQKLSKDLEFENIQTSFTKLTTSMLLNFANVTGVKVFTVRQLLNKYEQTEAVQIIDNFYL